MTINEDSIHSLITGSRLIHSETDFQRIPIEAEIVTRELIRNGKYEEIHFHPFSKLEGNLGIMAVDPLTQYTYIAVGSITVWSRIAVEQGVIPDDAFDLSDASIRSPSVRQSMTFTLSMSSPLSCSPSRCIRYSHRSPLGRLQKSRTISAGIFSGK